jgi:hypothetical protein
MPANSHSPATRPAGPCASTSNSKETSQCELWQFGSKDHRNYTWHSIVGVTTNGGKAYEPDHGFVGRCPGATNPCYGCQALSKLTAGLRFSICETVFDAVFQRIAQGVKSVSLSCQFEIPKAPGGVIVNPSKTTVEYTTAKGQTQSLGLVSDPKTCSSSSFYIEAGKVHLCPAACEAIRTDPGAKVKVLFSC